MQFGLYDVFAPEFLAMRGVEQGDFHHLDVWEHSLLVVRNAGPKDLVLALASLLHDIGKPATRVLDDGGRTRFFGHEKVSGDLAEAFLKRLRYPNDVIESVVRLVRNHMRITSMAHFTSAAARRLLRDMGDDTDRLVCLVEADAKSLRPGVKSADLEPIKAKLAEINKETPRSKLESPLSGLDIMCLLGVSEGPLVGKVKDFLLEQVLEGNLRPEDRNAAIQLVKTYARNATRHADVRTGI
jgi:poly(A) polymerase